MTARPAGSPVVAALGVLMAVSQAVFAKGDAADTVSPSDQRIVATIDRAVRFYATQCVKHGGYVYRYSGDLSLSEGEAETGPDTIWVQPPGTPTVGEAFLDAYDAIQPIDAGKAADYLAFAKDGGVALSRGRLHSGGWHYAIHFDDASRRTLGYVTNDAFRSRQSAFLDRSSRDKRNITTLDDDTTPAAIRFLVRLDDRLGGSDERITQAARQAIDAVVLAQRANGGWPQNWWSYPTADTQPAAPRASLPDEWSRTWGKDYPGRYYLNDDVAGQTIRALLDAYDHFGEERYREAAIRGGDFLLSARLPSPQPGWAQQYDENMHPCWDRKFEPPAISGEETQDAVRILVELTKRTGEGRFIKGIKETIAYLNASEIEPGKLARFYELRTNRPLFFDRDYNLTDSRDDLPTHYGFVVANRADDLWEQRMRVKNGKPANPPPPRADLVAAIIDALDTRGAWVNRDGNMKGYDKARRGGTIESATFAKNVGVLTEYLTRGGGRTP